MPLFEPISLNYIESIFFGEQKNKFVSCFAFALHLLDSVVQIIITVSLLWGERTPAMLRRLHWRENESNHPHTIRSINYPSASSSVSVLKAWFFSKSGAPFMFNTPNATFTVHLNRNHVGDGIFPYVRWRLEYFNSFLIAYLIKVSFRGRFTEYISSTTITKHFLCSRIVRATNCVIVYKLEIYGTSFAGV